MRIGIEYGESRDVSEIVQYAVSRFLADGTSAPFNDWLNTTPFKDVFSWNASEVKNSLLIDFN